LFLNAEIISVGTELLLGEINNTDASFLARELAALGINVLYQSTVGDNAERLKKTLMLAMARSEFVILTGGLGPTGDDITKEVVCETLGFPLVPHKPTRQRIEAYFEKIHKTPTENNLKQGLLPEDCIVFENQNGTAPGLALEKEEKIIILLPGPPNELEPMFLEQVRPYILNFADGVIYSRTLHIFGLGESAAEEKIADLMQGQNPTVAPYAKRGEMQIRITAKDQNIEQAKARIAPVEQEVENRLQGVIYGKDEDTLESVVVRALQQNGMTVATAESCTAGLLSKRITDVQGASAVFGLGVVSYANDSKEELLGVPGQTIETYGAVSFETSAAMALGIRERAKSNIGIGMTGIAGPDGGTKEKPVGTVFITVTDGITIWAKELHLEGRTRSDIRYIAASHALSMIQKYVSALPGLLPGGLQLQELADQHPNRLEAITPAFGITTKKDEPMQMQIDLPQQQEEKDEEETTTKIGRTQNIIPKKKDSIGEKLRKAALILSILALLVCVGFLVYDLVLTPMQNQGENDSLRTELTQVSGGEGAEAELRPDFPELLAINPETKAWISIKGTKIYYPVVQAKDNDKYLKITFYGKRNKNGTLFFDYRNKITTTDVNKNTIIYGHNMGDGQMFGQLLSYKKIDYYRAHPLIQMDTIHRNGMYKVFAVYITNTVKEQGDVYNYLRTNFADDEDFAHYISEVEMRSMISTTVDVRGDDEILTLSTCTNDIKNGRLVVAARRVRPGESTYVDTGGARTNPKPLMPDEWYRKNNKTKPDFDTDSTVPGQSEGATDTPINAVPSQPPGIGTSNPPISGSDTTSGSNTTTSGSPVASTGPSPTSPGSQTPTPSGTTPTQPPGPTPSQPPVSYPPPESTEPPDETSEPPDEPSDPPDEPGDPED